jgi:hypothetical protein
MLKRLFGATEGPLVSSGGGASGGGGAQSIVNNLANLKETLSMLEKREVRVLMMEGGG